jgi:hypothetical protein
MSEPVKIVIVMEGGIVQGVVTAGVPVRVVIVDYDVDGMDPDELVRIPQENAVRTEPASVVVYDADDDGPWTLAIHGMAEAMP